MQTDVLKIGTRGSALALAQATESCWAAILQKTRPAFGRFFRDSFEAQIAMFPNMLTPTIQMLIEQYGPQALGWKISGAGGGGYVIFVAEQPIPDAVRVIIRREDHLNRNGALLIGRDGAVIGCYDKVHATRTEREGPGSVGGDTYPVFDLDLGRVGMMICYDGFFPEVARQLSIRGAEVIASFTGQRDTSCAAQVQRAVDAAFQAAFDEGIIDSLPTIKERGYYKPTKKTGRPRRVGKVYQWRKGGRLLGRRLQQLGQADIAEKDGKPE